ncbi:hypothetical protein T4D_16135 [Trichinella pseudospiralis]|uniref:Uncharacterized protein n=1 Tax=Trichinella pseudospiralis TaxID=6337 RepID=A0A0V1FZT5_TRIPS|nr:hypothetical protein T4D_16135 [Trichinella pseudospiralis]
MTYSKRAQEMASNNLDIFNYLVPHQYCSLILPVNLSTPALLSSSQGGLGILRAKALLNVVEQNHTSQIGNLMK